VSRDFQPDVFFILHMASNSPKNSRYSLEIVGFGDLNGTAEAASVVLMRPRNPQKKYNTIFSQKGSFQHKTISKKVWLPRFQWDPGSRFGGLNETAKEDSAVSMRLGNPLWHRRSLCENDHLLTMPLKGYNSKKYKYICKHYIHIVTRNLLK
jgi:hypothetical protein